MDPWSNVEVDQSADGLKAASLDFNWSEWRWIFEVNMAPFAAECFNYLHMTGEQGGKTYAPGLVVESETFGRTTYSGRIGLLHIDGNHSYEHVRTDCQL